MSVADDCRHSRIAIGGDPHRLPPDVSSHVATCAACRQFLTETLALDDRLRTALELPLAKFRQGSRPPARRFALAASVVLALFAGGGFWLLSSKNALAGEVVEHVRHESGSWDSRDAQSPAALAAVLQAAGVGFDTSMPVIYAMACPFRGRAVPHLVVRTASGPMTVMLLANEKVAARQEFSEEGYRGVLLPAGEGSVAVLMRNGEIPAAIEAELVSGVRW